MKFCGGCIHQNQYIIIYRLIMLSIFLIGGYYGYRCFYPNDTYIELSKVLVMLKFFTCITQNLVFMYYLTSIIFLLFGYKNLHAYFYVSTFAYDMTMMSIYWAANFYDQTMITSIEDLKYMPIWFNHFAHTYGLPALLLDAYLCIPKCVSFKKSMMVSFPLGMAYNIYVETGILLWNTSPYPEILKYGFPLRYISYVSVWLNLMFFTYVGTKIVEYLNNTYNINKNNKNDNQSRNTYKRHTD